MKKLPALAGLLDGTTAKAAPAAGIDEAAIKAEFAALRRSQQESVH